MTFSDLIKLIKRYIKLVILVPLICIVVSITTVLLLPNTYVAKATLLTSGDVSLAAGFAQSEAAFYSQNDIFVTASTETGYRTISIEAEGKDYGGCIAAANATVLAAADDCREVTEKVSVTANEATFASSTSPSLIKTGLVAFVVGLFVAICVIIIFDIVKAPIKSGQDAEDAAELPVIGVIPNRDRGERLLANVRFLSDEIPSTIAVVPAGLTGTTLTCAELTSAFENAGFSASRVKGSAHAQGLNTIAIPGVISIIECASLDEGVGAVYIAREADLTIVCVNQWIDTRKSLESVVDELKFAKAKVKGIVYLSSRYSGRRY